MREVLDNSRDALYRRNLRTGTYDYFSPAIEALTGYTAEEMIALTSQGTEGFLHPEDRAAYQAHIQILLASPDPSPEDTVEYRWKTKGGAYRWFSNNRRLVRDEAGQPMALVGTLRDITERKRVEQEREQLLAEIERRAAELDATVEAISDGLIIYGPGKSTLRMNAPAERIMGFSKAEWDAMSHPERARAVQVRDEHGQPIPADQTPLSQALRGEQTTGHHAVITHRDGRVLHVLSSTAPIRDEEGKIIGAISNLSDITAEITLRERVQAERARLEAVLEALPVGVWITDENGQIISKNPAADRIWAGEAPLLESIGAYPQYTAWYADSGKMLRPEDYPVAQALQTGQSVGSVELRIRRFDGSEGTVLVSATPIRDAQGQLVGVVGVNVDITERKQAEEALRESEATLDAFFDVSPGILNLFDEELRYIKSDRTTPTYFNLDRHSIVGKSVWDLNPPFAEDFLGPMARQVIGNGKTVLSIEVPGPVPSRQGEMGYWSVSYFPVPLPGGKRGLGVMGLDITERKQVEEALQESEARLRTILGNLVEGVVLLDAEGVVRYVSDAARDAFGRVLPAADGTAQSAREAVQSLLGRSVREPTDPTRDPRRRIVRGDGTPFPVEELPGPKALRTGQAVRNVEMGVPQRDGTRIWVTVNAQPILDAKGHVQGVVVSFFEITERKETEEALRESEERFRTLADNISQLAWMADGTGLLFWYNKRWYEYTGTTLEEMQGWGWQKVHHPDHVQRVVEKFSHSLATGEVWEDTFPLRGKDGQYRWFLSRAIPIRDEQGKIVRWFGTNTDITELREAEEALRETQGKLRALNETLEQQVIERTARLRGLALELTRTEERERRRLAQLLHDHLQQLLAAARISVNMVRNRVEDKRQAETLSQVDGLLEESIAESRSLTTELSPPVLYDAGLAPAVDWLARWMEEKYHLTVEVQAEEMGNEVPEETRLVLFRGARELLFNVVKHTGVDRARVELRRLPEDQIELVVSDQGVGMDPAQMGKQQAEGGFGLFSVRERLESLGGRMQIDSAPGEGTRVTLRLPLRPTEAIEEEAARAGAVTREMAVVAAEELVAEREEAERAAVAGVQAVRVLLADDHVIMRQGLARLLEDEPGIELVGQANDGREVVELARATQPDIVLMDVSMPVMDGIEATRRIVADLPDVRVVGLSMYEGAEVETRMREAGAVDYVPKGGNPVELVEAVRKWGKS